MKYDPHNLTTPNPPLPGDLEEDWNYKMASLIRQLCNATDWIHRRARAGKLRANEFLFTLTVIERIHHDIEEALGCVPHRDLNSPDRTCDHVPTRMQRGCPWPTCQLGGDREKGTASRAFLGNNVPKQQGGSSCAGTIADFDFDTADADAGDRIEIADHERVTCDYCNGDGCEQCGGLGHTVEAHESIE